MRPAGSTLLLSSGGQQARALCDTYRQPSGRAPASSLPTREYVEWATARRPHDDGPVLVHLSPASRGAHRSHVEALTRAACRPKKG
jgi:hypothetical protein